MNKVIRQTKEKILRELFHVILEAKRNNTGQYFSIQ